MVDETIRVLLVEDNPGDARLIREMLREARDAFALHTTGTLREALDALHTQPFDVVLLDLSLPDSFGVETVQTACAAAPDLPIVVLTGFNDEQSGLQAVQAGAQDYLLKGETSSYILSRAIRYALERHRAEVALRRSEEEYRSLINDVFNTSTVGVLILDREFRVVWINEATEEYFNVRRADVLGHDKRVLVEDVLKCIFEYPDEYARMVLTAYEQHDFTARFECHVLPGENRQERWLEHWSQPIHDGMYAGGRIEYYTDITQRKLIEAAEREQSRAVAALEERQRLARELHDSVSQTLFTTSVMAESALRQLEHNPAKARALVEELHHLTHSALAEMRVLLLELRPASLTKVQFNQLVEQLIRSLSSRRLLTIHVEMAEVPLLPPDVQIALYRILQESLNNIVKHANARHVHIRVWLAERALHLRVEDDGQGFVIDNVGGGSLGLNIMRERAASVGATVSMTSQPGEGTCVEVAWPLPLDM